MALVRVSIAPLIMLMSLISSLLACPTEIAVNSFTQYIQVLFELFLCLTQLDFQAFFHFFLQVTHGGNSCAMLHVMASSDASAIASCWDWVSPGRVVDGTDGKAGTPMSEEMANVWAVIFVLPLNSALNPFLYTLNGLAERWKKEREATRMKKMISKLHSEIPKWTPAAVEELTRTCLRSGHVFTTSSSSSAVA
nr:hypothetical protein BaRGS_028297 [Batillaria attramentaria]